MQRTPEEQRAALQRLRDQPARTFPDPATWYAMSLPDRILALSNVTNVEIPAFHKLIREYLINLLRFRP